MKKPRARSLQWVLVRRLILLQAATLLIFIVLCAAALWIANPRLLVDNEAAVAALKDAVDRDGNGKLIVHETDELRSFREGFPNVWYIVRDADGQSVRFGTIPDVYARNFGDLLIRSRSIFRFRRLERFVAESKTSKTGEIRCKPKFWSSG